MANSNSLVIGNPYFMISFFDNEGHIPEIETLVYVGKNLLSSNVENNDAKDIWYFQNPKSYLSKGAFNTLPPGDYDVYQMDIKNLEQIYDLDELSKRLLDPYYDY